MDRDLKNSVSHRGKAGRLVMEYFQQRAKESAFQIGSSDKKVSH